MKKLGELLVEREWVTREQLTQALRHQQVFGGRLGTCLLELTLLSEDRLTKALSDQLGVPAVTQDDLRVIADSLTEAVPAKLACRVRAIPFERFGNALSIAVVDVRDLQAQDELAFVTSKRLKVHVAPEVRILEALEKHYNCPAEPRYSRIWDRLNRAKYLWQEEAPAAGGRRRPEAPPTPEPIRAVASPQWQPPPPLESGVHSMAAAAATERAAEHAAHNVVPPAPPVVVRPEPAPAPSAPAPAKRRWFSRAPKDAAVAAPVPDAAVEERLAEVAPSRAQPPAPMPPAPAPPALAPPSRVAAPPAAAIAATPAASPEAPAPPAAPPPRPPAQAPVASPAAPPRAAAPGPPPTGVSSPPPGPSPRPSAAPPPAAAPAAAAPPGDTDTLPPAPTPTPLVAAAAAPSAAVPAPAAAIEQESSDTSPLLVPKPVATLADFEARMGEVEERDDVAHAALSFLSRRFQRSLLFMIRGETVAAWMGGGEGVDQRLFGEIKISFDEPSLFLNLREGTPFYRGALPRLEAHQRLVRAWGGKYPKECLLLPVRIKKRLVAAVYCDGGHDDLAKLEMGELQQMASLMGRGFEAFLVKRKQLPPPRA